MPAFQRSPFSVAEVRDALDPPFERPDVAAHIDAKGLPLPTQLDDFDFSRTLDGVDDLGLDPTGSSPVQGDISDALSTSGTRVHLPEGHYRVSGAVRASGVENVALTGDDGARLVADSGIYGLVVDFSGDGNTRNVALSNVDIDHRNGDCSANVRGRVGDGLVIEDVEFIGYSHPDDSEKKIVPLITSSSGSGIVQRCTLTDGTEVGRQGVSHNNVHKQQFDGGMWSGPPHEGTCYIVDCEVANWSDNALYASRTRGGIVVIGGYYANSSISQVRVSHEDSFVGGGCHIEIDRDKIPEINNPSGLASARGIWLEPGHMFGNQGVVIGDVYLRMGSSTPHIPGMINVARSLGDVNIVGPVEIEVEGSHRAIYARTPDGRIRDPPPTPHSIRMSNVTIVGDGDVSPVLIDIEDRPGSYVADSCIQHTGAGVTGVRFRGDRGAVRDSTVNVSGTAVSGGSVENVSTSGSCSVTPPSEREHPIDPDPDPDPDPDVGRNWRAELKRRRALSRLVKTFEDIVGSLP